MEKHTNKRTNQHTKKETVAAVRVFRFLNAYSCINLNGHYYYYYGLFIVDLRLRWWKGGKEWLHHDKMNSTINNLNWWHHIKRESNDFNIVERCHRLTAKKNGATWSVQPSLIKLQFRFYIEVYFIWCNYHHHQTDDSCIPFDLITAPRIRSGQGISITCTINFNWWRKKNK